MPPFSAGVDPLVDPPTGALSLDESLLRLARLAPVGRADDLLLEVSSTLRLAAVSLWEIPEGSPPEPPRLVAAHVRRGFGVNESAAPNAAHLARRRIVPASAGVALGAGPEEAGTPHGVELGVWRAGKLAGCLRCERAAAFGEVELLYLTSAADRLAVLQEAAIRQSAEDALAERDRKLDEVEELTKLGSWEWDIATDTITWSAEQIRIHGVDASVRTQSFGAFLDRVHPEDRDRVVDECARTLTTGLPFSFPYRILRHDGTEREMEALGKLLPGRSGRSARLVGISRDMTERNAAERALRASEESYRSIFENASDGIWVHELTTGAVLDINLAAATMFGYTREEMLRVSHADLLYPGTEYTEARVAEYMVRTAAGETPRFEWLGRHRDGSEVWAEITMRRLSIGGEDRILASARDIGERKAAERALHRVNEELERRVAERTAELAASNAALASEVEEHQAAREELACRTQQMVAVFAALPDAYFRLDRGGAVLDHRPAPGTDTAVESPELLGRRIQDCLPPSVGESFADALGEVIRTHALVCLEYDVPDGESAKSYEARILPSADGSLITIIRDITDRKASEEALRRSEEHFRALIENGSDYIMIVDRQATVTYVGPSVERILGYAPEELLGQRPEDLVHPEDHERVYATLATIIENPGRVATVEYRVRHRDGSWRLFENFGRTLHPDSADGGVVANGRDITDRRRAENEIARQKAYFEEILDSLDAGISVFDAKGRFEYTTASAIRDPHVRSWAIGKTIEEYGRARNLADEVVRERRQSIEEALATRTPNQFEQEVACPDGAVTVLLRRLIPIVDEGGEVVRLVGYSVDITDRKRVEVALQHAKEEAERANRAKSEFLSRMSHELRTPLNGILGFAQVLERRDARPDQQVYVGHILRGGRHLLRLINEVLELSRIEAGRMSLSLEPIALHEVVREAMDLVRPLAEEGGHKLELRSTCGADAYVHADRQRLAQILLNLFSNAIKYNRAGGDVAISCVRLGEESTTGYSILVEDRGKGIPTDRLDQLFTPFARLGAEQTDTEGTGLGLALSKRLAETMAGDLVLQSSGPEGSVFRLDLRCASNPLHSASEGEVSGGGGMESASVPASILYIEDNVTNLTLVETLFESRPHWTTISALRGQAGIDLAVEHRPDLILLDLHLPDVPGEEVLRQLRSNPQTAEIPVVVISADATGAAMNRLRAAGADDYLTKPLDLEEFLRTVERYLPA